MLQKENDTIAALATPFGAGGVGIVRISGKNSITVVDELFIGKIKPSSMQSHTIQYGKILDETNQILDEVILLMMHENKSYTMENVVEIQCHGGITTVQAILSLLYRNGVRPADPGEFTKRAFLNGRIDLAQAESVKDMINVKTEMGRKAAMKQLSGSLSHKIINIRDKILLLIAQVEASIDFPDEELSPIHLENVNSTCQEILIELNRLLQGIDKGKILKEGISTVILGRPNVGKSSLLNALLNEDRAIVTDIPGTTRDVLTEYINIKNIPIKIIDTAGIRQSDNLIEQMGVAKSKEYGNEADLIFMVLDGSSLLTEDDKEILSFILNKKVIILLNKSDLPQKAELEWITKYFGKDQIFTISAKDKTGLEQVYNKLSNMFFDGEITNDDQYYLTNLRQNNAILSAKKNIEDAMETIVSGLTEEFLAIDFLSAYTSLGEIIGETLGEDVINKIFAEFCVGK